MLTASGGPFRGRTAAELATVTADRRARAPHVDDGREDHDRLVDADEQGPRGDRGARAVRRRLRPHRRRRAPAVGRARHGRVRRRRDDRAALDARHAPADRARARRAATGCPRRSAPIDWTTLRDARRSSRPTAQTFRCLDLAYAAGRTGGTAPAVLSAANEIAVEAFLAGRIAWTGDRRNRRRSP